MNTVPPIAGAHRAPALILIAVLCSVFNTVVPAGPIRLQIRSGTSATDVLVGEVDEPGFEGWIDAVAFGNAFQRNAPVPGKRTVPSTTGFTVVKSTDKASPRLADALFKGTIFPLIKVVYLGFPNRSIVPTQVELGNAVVTSFAIVGSGLDGVAPIEEISFAFDEVRWIYNRFDRDNRLIESNQSTFDALLGSGDPLLDSDDDGVPNDQDPDDDNDGMPDTFELAAGLDPLFPGAELDFDGDGRTNFDEFVAGSAPNDPSSVFAIESISQRSADPGKVFIIFQIVPGRRYSIATSETGRDWREVDRFAVPTDSVDEEAEVEISIDYDSQLFRVEVTLE